MTQVHDASRVLVFGYGAHGRAVAEALAAHGIAMHLVDDNPTPAGVEHAAGLGEALTAIPVEALPETLEAVTHVIPTPGLPESHPVFSAAADMGRPVIGEFDLAAQWDDRPLVAITGTNGKTTVTTLVTEMLQASDINAVMAGNMDLPLVTAIANPAAECFVVEASSFRLGYAQAFRPAVATWLNFEPDHLDAHGTLARYEDAKAKIWAHAGAGTVAIANSADAVVMSRVPAEATVQYFGPGGDAEVTNGQLIVAGEPLIAVDRLARRLPHDLDNALAAALTALAAGASRDGVADALAKFGGIDHRMELVGEGGGVAWYNDSKATTPHAVLAGMAGFASSVLIAGGRNKGVDLTPLAELGPRLRGVVAIGDDAAEVAAVFSSAAIEVATASTMADAIARAAQMAQAGDTVVLSPACTSYDWYANYQERGADFRALVQDYLGATQ